MTTYDPGLFVFERLTGGEIDTDITGSVLDAGPTNLTLAGVARGLANLAGSAVLIPGRAGVRFSEVATITSNYVATDPGSEASTVDVITIDAPWTVNPTTEDTFDIVYRAEAGDWAPIECAGFSYSAGYTVDDNGTLIFEAETGQATMSYWSELEAYPVNPSYVGPTQPLHQGDIVRAVYDGHQIGTFIVDTTSWAFTVDPEAPRYGGGPAGRGKLRMDFTCGLVGRYAQALGRVASWTDWPAESPLRRISHSAQVLNLGALALIPSDPTPITLPVEGAGSSSMLDLIKAFSGQVRRAVRVTGPITLDLVDPQAEIPGFIEVTDGPTMYHSLSVNTLGGTVPGAVAAWPPRQEAKAELITNDTRIITTGWRIPLPLPAIRNGPTRHYSPRDLQWIAAPVKHVTMAFGKTSFSAAVEFHFRFWADGG